MTEWFPSEEWLERYRTRLNENETYATTSAGWGVDFNGDFLFRIERLPTEEETIGDLPDDLTDELDDRLASLSASEHERIREASTDAFDERFANAAGEDRRERFRNAVHGVALADVPEVVWPELRAELPADLDSLLEQLETYVTDDRVVYAALELEDGECRRAEILADPDEFDPGFVLGGPYSTWKELVDGADVMESVMSRDMELEGSVTTVLEYNEAAAAMGDTAGETASRHLF